MSQVIRLPQVIRITALARSTIYQYVADGKFPKPIKLGDRSSGWLLAEIEEWLEEKRQARKIQGDD